MKIMRNLTLLVMALVLTVLPVLIAAQKPEEQFKEQRQADAKKQEAETTKAENQDVKGRLANINLPEDTTPILKVKEIRFVGNTLVSTSQLVAGMPAIFNASDMPVTKAESKYLYNLSPVKEVLSTPGRTRDISARTIQGLTQYVLSVYQRKNYGGIYVYVPAESLKGGTKLQDDILQVTILEASVSAVGAKYYDVNQAVVEKGQLDANALLGWSPAKSGKVLNRKQLDDYINLLNENPDRYVSATVSQGTEPNTLAVNYGVYEANPWHFFFQVDNSGVKGREWNPKIGAVNTNLLGRDDSFFAMYQVPWDSEWQENYSLFGSYDFPLTGPELRLNIYGGYSAFNLATQDSDLDFLGGGKFIGANLRYTVLQHRGWFFDIIGSVSEEESDETPFFASHDIPEATSTVRMTLVGGAIDIHKRDDTSNSSLGYKFTINTGGSDSEEFDKSRPPVPPAGPGADKYFTIHTFSAAHTRNLDPNKVTQLSATARWIVTDDRLPPAKMTPFGGMYSVRGYKEYETIADGGFLGSVQYEFDLVRYEKTNGASKQEAEDADKSKTKKFGLKKLAPLAFFDFGRTDMTDHSDAEKAHETFMSLGPGVLAELGDNFSAGLYWGIALRDTEFTNAGDSRVNVTFMARW
ncbi:MAG: ShlB/FhaC/HecB family hemolysin secretion/activation protein [Sedimentisphaerales bacterium]|jgi:hemolysin activation/secretion protein